MGNKIVGLDQWLETPPGKYLLEWECEQFHSAVVDAFGYHALQLGLPAVQALASNRMPHRWQAVELSTPAAGAEGAGYALECDFAALPFSSASLDLVTLPHTLETSPDPHATLREVERVLVPDGRVVITCFNPSSLWGLAQKRSHLYRRMGFGEPYLPQAGEFMAYRRLRDWLRLLGFEVESSRFGCYRPAMASQAWLDRTAWMDAAGGRWWPIFGSAYCIVAVKRVRGMRLISPAWKTRKVTAAAPVSVARKRLETLAPEVFDVKNMGNDLEHH